MTDDTPWWVYFLERQGGSIYIDIAKDVDARFETHAKGQGAGYTRMNPPVRIPARQAYPSHRAAARAEHARKRWTALEKRQWIIAFNGRAFISVAIPKSYNQR